MKFKIVASAMMAICAIAVLGVTQASATELLNKAGRKLEKNTFTSFTGLIIIETTGGVSIMCKTNSRGSGTIESTTEGKEVLTGEGCELAGNACSTAGDGAGFMLLPWSVAFGSGPGEKRYLGMTLSGVASFTCGTAEVEIRGGFLAELLSPINTFRKAFLFNASQTGGVPGATEYTVAGKKISVKLEVSIEKGAFEQAGASGIEEIVLEEEAKLT